MRVYWPELAPAATSPALMRWRRVGEIGGDDFLGETLAGPLMRTDLSALGTNSSIPFFIAQGAEDDITPASLAQAYFDRVRALRKAFLLIPDPGHLALLTRPDVFLKFLLTNVRSVALSAGQEPHSSRLSLARAG
jgi:pimeloyl-ACP methyl ester carboxylesterase